MKKLKFLFKSVFILATFTLVSCEEENYELGAIIAPSNVQITAEIIGVDEANPNGDGSGTVHFNVSANNALTYKLIFDGVETLVPSGKHTINFSVTGTHTYIVHCCSNWFGWVYVNQIY